MSGIPVICMAIDTNTNVSILFLAFGLKSRAESENKVNLGGDRH